MSFARRYRVAMLAACVGVAAGMVSWLGGPSGGTAATTPPVPGQQIESGTVRHVVNRPGVGTAFVVDRLGSDRLSVTIHGVVKTAPTEGEVTNPAISESGTRCLGGGPDERQSVEPAHGRVVDAQPTRVYECCFLADVRVEQEARGGGPAAGVRRPWRGRRHEQPFRDRSG